MLSAFGVVFIVYSLQYDHDPLPRLVLFTGAAGPYSASPVQLGDVQCYVLLQLGERSPFGYILVT